MGIDKPTWHVVDTNRAYDIVTFSWSVWAPWGRYGVLKSEAMQYQFLGGWSMQLYRTRALFMLGRNKQWTWWRTSPSNQQEFAHINGSLYVVAASGPRLVVSVASPSILWNKTTGFQQQDTTGLFKAQWPIKTSIDRIFFRHVLITSGYTLKGIHKWIRPVDQWTPQISGEALSSNIGAMNQFYAAARYRSQNLQWHVWGVSSSENGGSPTARWMVDKGARPSINGWY